MEQQTVFGENIRRIRKKWGYKQSEFGEYLGDLSSAQIGKYETGDSYPRVPLFMKIVKLTGISAYKLYFEIVNFSEIPDRPIDGDYDNHRLSDRVSDPSEVYVSDVERLTKMLDFMRRELEDCRNSK